MTEHTPTDSENSRPKTRDRTKSSVPAITKKTALAAKPTNHPIQKQEVKAVPILKRALPQLPPKKRTRLEETAGVTAAPDTSAAEPKTPKRARGGKCGVSLQGFSAGLGIGVAMLAAPFGSSGALEAVKPSSPRAMADAVVVSPPISSPPASWFKDKVISSAKKAADRLRRHRKGYEVMRDVPAPKKMKGKPLSKQETMEDDPFGDLAEISTMYACSNASFNSFLLNAGDDELSLPNGSYVVSYRDEDTVITAAVHRNQEIEEEDDEGMEESPLAQFTPLDGWQLRRKKGFSRLKDLQELFPEEEERSEDEVVAIDRTNLSILIEVDSEEEAPDATVFGLSFPAETPHRVVKKTGRSNLRAANGGGKKYGKKVSRAFTARDMDMNPFNDEEVTCF